MLTLPDDHEEIIVLAQAELVAASMVGHEMSVVLHVAPTRV